MTGLKSCGIMLRPIASREPVITINGSPLSEAQCMAVRSAIESLRSELYSPKFMRELGDIGPIYLSRLNDVAMMMYG